jgi:uncharacterized MAPEG superfamily protein
MPVEWPILVIISAFYWGLGQVTGIAKTKVAGTAWNRGNRETDPPVPEWVTRTEKAQRNLLESYPLFLSLVLVLSLSHHLSDLSALGAGIWFAARLAHAALFMAGVTGWRTGAYLVSLVGLGLMAIALF